ncbi:MogA/MoaB family molybdenum cofactor biosynthesis protein [Corynebacterium sp. SCR221107]|uniref:MogA/MoaB family molybdenum cofactor biosynthesis protein n=2 Tax=Bacteria TaxID=2 RepID=UPI0022EC77EF|nr:MogA/MoaB family molybdenum cofactor biosynthesis protein [Corynebacterium sp. SCR221107]WBT09571.1 MogA/MoaB family molybdenum cofactor biosynthesis protein [Corynebacterium sp. SCR221107]
MSGRGTESLETADETPEVEGEFGGFLEVGEPDAEFFRATEAEAEITAPRRALVVLISDHVISSGEDTDRLCTELLEEGGFVVDAVLTTRNKRSQIRKAIETAVIGGVDLVLTVGGTGVGPRDRTPEATRDVLDMHVPGIAQALRSSGLACGAVDACTSRGISGVSGSTVVVNLAASRAAIRDGMATLTPLVHHLVDQLRRSTVD